jgi:uncharacterized protein YndB with AHSA1/START domain
MTRSHEHEIEIEANPDQVWRALTDADQLTGWYVERAEVEPRAGGKYFISWGEGMDGWGKIDVWEPPHRLRLVHLPAGGGDPGPNDPPLDEPIIEEYTIEASGGTTVLRMVNSGIPDSADWDSFYDGTDVGWDGFFLALRHYLLHHAGEPRKALWFTTPLVDGPDVAWDRLNAAMAKTGTLSGLAAGDRYDITTSLGDHLFGEVVAIDPSTKLLLSVDPMDKALLEASIVPSPEHGYVSFAVWLWGDQDIDGLRSRWEPWIKEAVAG